MGIEIVQAGDKMRLPIRVIGWRMNQLQIDEIDG
jgi:hypothetical protein